MKIFRENGKIRLQLMDMRKGVMLFDFAVDEEDFIELKEHVIQHLNDFKTVKKEE